MNYSAGTSDGVGAPGPSARAAVVPDSRRLQLAQVRLRDLASAAFSGRNAQLMLVFVQPGAAWTVRAPRRPFAVPHAGRGGIPTGCADA
jgi:hypothetical protein